MANYKLRRNKIAEGMKDHSLLLLFSGTELKRSADAVYDFSVNRNFYYLTGIKQDHSFLLIKKVDGMVSETLFTSAYNKAKEIWTGKRLTPEEALAISGVSEHANSEDFEASFKSLLVDKLTIYLDLEEGLTISDQLLTKDVAELLEADGHEVLDIYEPIIRLRMVKDDYEVALIKESITLTHKAIKHGLSVVRPGVHEYEFAAAFEYVIKAAHGELGFNTIAASGENAVILHYPSLDAKMKDGDLLLLDLGGHNNMYTADISRTVPVSQKVSPLQKNIYNIVLACNKAVINRIKPGLTLLDLQNFTKEFLKQELVKAKIIKEDDDIINYYYHGVSHHLGLDTHDASIRSLPLEVGNVITVEPGLYFAEYGIGVRIEDNVLVTKDGALNLSVEIPKEFSDYAHE